MRMAGVPEATFDFWAAKFIGKGFKVAKVDQLENALSKTMREKSEKSSAEKIIRRELTSILTCGTLVDGNHLKSNNANYCISFKLSESSCQNEVIVGSAFVDASSAKFYLVDFVDDNSFVMLNTLLAQISPKEVIVEKVG
jgi:DNA mismatch repair protein MSH6